MIGEATLKVTPEVLNAQANKVTAELTKITSEFDKLGQTISRTKGYWIGEAGELHRQMYESQKDSIQQILKRLKEHPRDLQAIAQNYSATELKIQELISELPNDVIS